MVRDAATSASPAAPSRVGAFGALCGFGFLPQAASAAGARDPRFVVIILRGAVDGLSAVPPVGDPDYAGAARRPRLRRLGRPRRAPARRRVRPASFARRLQEPL